MKGPLDRISWKSPPFPFLVVVAVVVLTIALAGTIGVTALTAQYPNANVEFDFAYVEHGTEVTVTLTENENAKEVIVRADEEDWDNGANEGSDYDDWGRGASLTETGDSSTNLLTHGSGTVTVVGTYGLLGQNEAVIETKTYNAH